MFRILRLTFREKGTTLVEIIVVIFIIAVFSSILVANFPKILRQFALSRATYKLSQDLRKVQDLGLSGVLITEQQEIGQGFKIESKGYGLYVDLNENSQYIIYADRGSPSDSKYNGNLQLCSENTYPELDCILELIALADENPDLYIKEIANMNLGFANTSINFAPPNPNITIDNLGAGSKEIGVVLGLRSEPSLTRTVWANTSGLIRVE